MLKFTNFFIFNFSNAILMNYPIHNFYVSLTYHIFFTLQECFDT